MSLGASRGGLLLGIPKVRRELDGPADIPFVNAEPGLYRLGCIVLNEGLLGFRCEPILRPKFGLAENALLADGSCELPNTDEGGGPAGVNEPADEGGGPAGVVVGLVARFMNEFPKLPLRVRRSGVEGVLEDNGTVQPDIVSSCVELSA